MESENGVSDKFDSTTLITVITPRQIVYVGNAGDSRIVMSVAGLAKPLPRPYKSNNNNERQRIYQAGGRVMYNV